jgi:hypothetical protein
MVYCDSRELEQAWFHWILASSVPQLEQYRRHGLLWTKILKYAEHEGKVLMRGGEPLSDPSHGVRRHCVAFARPVYFETVDGEAPETVTATDGGDVSWWPYSEVERALSLESDHYFHALLANPFTQSLNIKPALAKAGYVQERPENDTWHHMLTDISNICQGISMNFKMPSDEERQDLASDAFLQITNKLTTGRLVYLPGRAPVFNLLTTTVYRIIYSILNKRTNQRNGIRRLIDDAAAGTLPPVGRSLRIPHIPHIRSRARS